MMIKNLNNHFDRGLTGLIDACHLNVIFIYLYFAYVRVWDIDTKSVMPLYVPMAIRLV